MQRESLRAAPLAFRLAGRFLEPLLVRFVNTTVERAAYSTVHAATAPDLADRTGLYLGPDGTPTNSSSWTRDPSVAATLWTVVADMTGVESPGDPELRSYGDPELGPFGDHEPEHSEDSEATPSADPEATPSADPEATPSADPGAPPSTTPVTEAE